MFTCTLFEVNFVCKKNSGSIAVPSVLLQSRTHASIFIGISKQMKSSPFSSRSFHLPRISMGGKKASIGISMSYTRASPSSTGQSPSDRCSQAFLGHPLKGNSMPPAITPEIEQVKEEVGTVAVMYSLPVAEVP